MAMCKIKPGHMDVFVEDELGPDVIPESTPCVLITNLCLARNISWNLSNTVDAHKDHCRVVHSPFHPATQVLVPWRQKQSFFPNMISKLERMKVESGAILSARNG